MMLVFHWKDDCKISKKIQIFQRNNAPVKTDRYHVHDAGGRGEHKRAQVHATPRHTHVPHVVVELYHDIII